MESKKRKYGDESYFQSYADITIHEDMIADEVRTGTYRQAILKNYKDFYGKVVLDVGAGTGILSMFCVQAGAKKVYAVEASNLADETRKAVAHNKMADKITVVHSRVEDADIPEKVDIIVSEWMGYFLLYETMLPSVLFARDKWLKQGGLLFPTKATLSLAPIADISEFEEELSFWVDAGTPYKLDLSTFKSYSHSCHTRGVHIRNVEPSEIIAKQDDILTLDLSTITTETLSKLTAQFRFVCLGGADIDGFVAWFSVDFPGDVSLSTSPYKQMTHWAQSVLRLSKPVSVQQDSVLHGTITLSPNSDYNRYMDIDLSYEADKGSSVNQCFVMKDSG